MSNQPTVQAGLNNYPANIPNYDAYTVPAGKFALNNATVNAMQNAGSTVRVGSAIVPQKSCN
ncbi:MAG: hypothetical protein U0930_22000 [Pirellulales bacterium]